MDVVLQVEHVSKHYRLGTIGAESLKQKIHQWWTSNIFPRQSSFQTEPWQNEDAHSQDLWALKNVSFEVFQGDVLGFVGGNGAGKSTLLKILSRITKPTRGAVRGKGRVASLLEVGTGFHGELTGRENIYLNGQILGMKTKEIDRHFDEIVEFSGVGKFLDTPVKRYSSGMYVRLAFAVAAHLDAEILIVDEALAVGDEEFQRKCLSKMREVSSQEGRTVLFVSHNLVALQNLCNKAIYLNKGQLLDIGNPEKVIARYLKNERVQCLLQEYPHPSEAPGNDRIRIKKVAVEPHYNDGRRVIDNKTALDLTFEIWSQKQEEGLTAGIQLFNLSGECIFDVCSDPCSTTSGLVKGRCTIPANFLNDGSYYISMSFGKRTSGLLYLFEACLSFDVTDNQTHNLWQGKWPGVVRPGFKIEIEHNEKHIVQDDKILSIQHQAFAA